MALASTTPIPDRVMSSASVAVLTLTMGRSGGGWPAGALTSQNQ